MKKKITLNIFCSFLLCTGMYAQDVHMSQLHAGPLLFNPAMTGLYNGDMRFVANYKSQWKSIGTNYSTSYASVEMKTRHRKKTTSGIGVGLEVFADQAGDLGFSQKGALLTFSGIQLMGGYKGKQLLSAGFKAGYIMSNFDPTKIIAFDEELLVLANTNNNTGYFDLSAGLTWMHQLDKNHNSYLFGISLSHINKPEISYGLSGTGDIGNKLYRKLILHGGGDFVIVNKLSVQPSFAFLDQGPNREITIGTFLGYNVNKRRRKKNDSKFSLQFGGWLRSYVESDVQGVDALVVAAKANIVDVAITFSYDINISSLSVVTNGRGGPELSIVHVFALKNAGKNSVRCPAFY